jgi:tetratricopeptide (TPR) repeat protein
LEGKYQAPPVWPKEISAPVLAEEFSMQPSATKEKEKYDYKAINDCSYRLKSLLFSQSPKTHFSRMFAWMTMMTNARNQAATFNNIGIAFLELGDRHQAETHFQAAIGVARGSIHRAIYFKSDQTHCSMMGILAERGAPLDLTKTHSLFSNTSSSLFVRTQGLSIPTTSIFSNDTLVDQLICSSIVIFNLALTYHERGTENCSMGVQYLRKARLFYEKSYKLLEGTGVVALGSFTGNPFVDVLEMSLLNNLVHINFELSDYAQSELYRHRLVRSASSTSAIASYYPHDLRLAALLEEERSNFLLNLIVTMTPPHAKAA